LKDVPRSITAVMLTKYVPIYIILIIFDYWYHCYFGRSVFS